MGVPLPPFQNFLDQHRDDVYRFLLASVGPSEVDDCFQETFLSALRAYPRLRGDSNLKAWVITIAHRKALDTHRSGSRRVKPQPELREHGAHQRNGHDPALWAAVRGLPPKQRAAVAHRFVNDLPYAQIGTVMSCSEDAARRSVHEGLKRLREEWVK